MASLDCLVAPQDSVLASPGLLQAAAKDLGRSDCVAAGQRVMDIDRRALWTYWFGAYSEWSRRHKATHHQSEAARLERLSDAASREVFKRDGWHCRYCGLRLVDRRAMKRLSRALPGELPWGNRNGNSHPAALVLVATLDHVDPRWRGGGHDPENLVTACGVCQYQAKGACTLDELQLADPRDRAPMVDSWDGLVSVTGTIGTSRIGGSPRQKFDPDLEYLMASARMGGFITTIKNPELLDKLAHILEEALPPPSV